jgi:acyl-CoA synthetase (AMP-forming)/AMP-acid ligase II
VPRRIEIVDELPRSPAGKILRREVACLVKERA